MSALARLPEFAEPLWLWLLVPALLLPPLLAIYPRDRLQSGRAKPLLSGVLRGLALAALTVALAGPLAGSYSRHTDVVFALDASGSIDRSATRDALRFINRTWAAKDPAARAGLIVFGADAVPEVLTRRDAEPVSQIASQVERGSTDIERALGVAIGAFPSDQHRRVVLLSDGRENLGKARNIAAVARSLGVEIFTVPLQQTLTREHNEIHVQQLSAPARVSADEPFELRMTLHSDGPARADLVLLRNGTVLSQNELQLQPGVNVFSSVEQVADSGLYEYEAVINSDLDGAQENNRYQTFVRVTGAPRVLHASGQPGWGQPLSDALRAQGLRVDEVNGTALPAARHELADYDLVILNNVPSFDLSQQKMALLESYVRDAGGGLISLGGDRSYAAGGYHGTPIERLLPVTMDLQSEIKIPSLVVVIVLDKSGSMASPSHGEQKILIAKRAALAAVEVLNALDRVGVLAFDADVEWSVPPTPAANRRAIAAKLRALDVGGGTDLSRALAEAHQVIARQQAKLKHLIVLSDGLSNAEADLDTLGRRIAADGITVSTVSLGGDADQTLMANLAQLGGGRYYHTDDPRNIPRIFTSEALVVSRDLVVERLTQPTLRYRSEMIAGFGDGSALQPEAVFPPLSGYQRTFAKPAAQVLLTAGDNTDAGASTSADPLLVSWRYGLGKSAAFMSDLAGRWGQRWVNWSEFGRFSAQLARWTMRSGGAESLLPSFRWQGRRGEIIIDALDRDERFINGLQLQAGVVGPDNNSRQVTLQQTAPGRYLGEFPVTATGRYYLNVSSAEGNAIAPKTFGLAVPYSSEYLQLGADEAFLSELASSTGGRLLAMTAESVQTINAAKTDSISERWRIWWPFLLAALVLLVLEIAVRKITLPETWHSRLRSWGLLLRRRPRPTGTSSGDSNEPEPETTNAALQATLARARSEHLQALRDGPAGSPEDLSPGARARLYVAGNKGR